MWEPDYAAVADFRSYLRVDDAVDDAEMALAVTAASRAVDDATGRQFGIVDTAEARIYEPRPDYGRGCWVADIDDLQTDPVSVEVDGQSVTDYELRPRNAAQKGMPWTELADLATGAEVTVTALWGWSSIPSTVRHATLLQASRFFARRQSPFGVAGSPETGSEMRLLARLDPDVLMSLPGNLRRLRSVG